MRLISAAVISVFAVSCSGNNDWTPPVLPDAGRELIEREVGEGVTIAMLPTGAEAEARGWLCGMASGASAADRRTDRSRLFVYDTTSGDLHIASDPSQDRTAMELMDDVEFFETFKACRAD